MADSTPVTISRAARVRQSGAALLAVLWLSAALAAIAFALANTERGETERASTSIEGMRAYYLATGAISRALLYIQWGRPYFLPGMTRLIYEFPTGHAEVELIPETSKLNINASPPEELFRLIVALGADPERAQQIVEAIIEWRTPASINQSSPLDAFYLSLTPSFRSRHASFEEIEEVLLVRGMTPDLFYGTYERDNQGRLGPRAGLRDCASVYGSAGQINVNAAEPAAMLALGVPPEIAGAILRVRSQGPITAELLAQLAPGEKRLTVAQADAMTLRATARLRKADGTLSRQSRSVAAVTLFNPSAEVPYETIRWYDNLWVK